MTQASRDGFSQKALTFAVNLRTRCPTWEPASNLPSGEVKKISKCKHKLVERAFIGAEAEED
ncbi:hypothetical protein PHMEG_0008843 [Phytophthora megakarya]|uniref:Uncharacterized protein n=1 Tax=Phytophthora megakarya TaxID=4795 RepID=A0A225WJ13_9STRA|nr:hypothetical protein PHMEG_0008843 [Phytophthora megakarya]